MKVCKCCNNYVTPGSENNHCLNVAQAKEIGLPTVKCKKCGEDVTACCFVALNEFAFNCKCGHKWIGGRE